MAQNLEMGMADDPQITRDFSRRILEESDRLTARVDQILQVARERERTRRGLLYGQIERALFDAPPYVPIAFYAKNSPVGVAMVRPVVHGARDRITGRLDAAQWRELWPSAEP